MWSPKQLLHERVIDALLLGGFEPLQIQFLGWLSYNAAALNNSRNPVKAAHTILGKATTLKMLEVFAKKKRETIEPPEKDAHKDADKIFAALADEIDTAITKATMRASTYEDLTKGGVSDGAGSITDAVEEDADGAAV